MSAPRPTTATTGRLRSIAGRLSWGLADQAVSSITNFVVGILVARSLDITDFGVFALVWATFGLVLAMSRGLVSDPFVVRFSGALDTERLPALARATGCAFAAGVIAGLICAVAGLVAGGPLGNALLALGVVLPGLLVQDAWRFGFFAASQGGRAFVNDAVWAAALVPAMAVAMAGPGVGAFVLAWGGAAAVAAVAGILQAGVRPLPLQAWAWLVQQRDLGARYVLEAMANSAASQFRMYGLGILAGLAAVGAVRGAELLIAPFLAVLMGVSLVAVPEAARVLRRNPRRLPMFCLLQGGAQAVAALAWGGGLLLLVQPSALTSLLGPVGPSAVPLLLPATVAVAFASFAAGATTGLRALGAARRSLRAQILFSVAYIVASLTGAVLGGALGSSWGAAAACLVGIGVWWNELRAETAATRSGA